MPFFLVLGVLLNEKDNLYNAMKILDEESLMSASVGGIDARRNKLLSKSCRHTV